MIKRLVLLFIFSGLGAGTAFADPPQTGGTTSSTDLKKDGPVRFYGLALDYAFWDGTTLNSASYNNTFSQLFLPAWNFGRLAFPGTRFATMALGGRFILDRELTGYDDASSSQFSDSGYAVRCSNIQPSSNGGRIDPGAVNRCQYDNNRRWHQSDITLILRNPKIVTIPYALININPSLSLILPTSAESQYQTMRAAPGIALGASRAFLDGKITVGYSIWFTKYLQQYTTPGVRRDGGGLQSQLVAAGYGSDDVAPTTENFLADPSHVGTIGGYNPNYSFRHTFSVEIAPTEKLSISALYILIDSFAYAAGCTGPAVQGQPTNLCDNGDRVAADSGSNILRTGHKDTQVLWLTVGYDVLDWLNINIAWINWAPQRKPDGSYRQPFISTNYDAYTSISLGATVSLEKAAAKLF